MNSPRFAVAPASAPKLDVLLFCHSQPARAALALWLSQQPDIVVVGATSTTTATLELAITTTPRIVLADVDAFSDAVGAAVSVLKVMTPEPEVIVLTHDVSEPMRHKARAAGVDRLLDETGGLPLLAHELERLRARLPGPANAGVGSRQNE